MFGNFFTKKENTNTVPQQPDQSQQTGQYYPQNGQNNQQGMQQNQMQNGVQQGQPGMQGQTPGLQQTQQSNGMVGGGMGPQAREEMSALSHLDPRSTQVLNLARQEALKLKQQFIEPEQLLLGLLFDGQIFQLLEGFSVNVASMARDIQNKEKEGTFTGQPTLSDTTKRIFELAYSIAKNGKAEFITPEDILAAINSANVPAGAYLQTQGIDKQKLQDKLAKVTGSNSGSQQLGEQTSFLDKFGTDLTALAKKGELDPVAGRDKEIERVIHILLRRIKNNPIIIGEAGVGKTAVVEGLAQKISSGSVPPDLQNKRIIQIDVASLVAGASHRGEFEDRLRSVIKEAQGSHGKVIIFIDEIHTLIGTGSEGEGAMDASNIIKPFLARGQLQIIGGTTTIEYRHYFEKDKAFERRFQTVLCEEPDEENAIKMMEILKPNYEKFHHVVVSPEAIEAAVKLSKRYIGERYLPDKAVDVMDESSADVHLRNGAGKQTNNQVTKGDIEKVIASWTGIPISKLTEDESEKLLHLEDIIHKRLINQEAAVRAVAEAVRRGRIGLASAMRPIASFIFLGPTGTGKTELAKTLAEILFGKEEAMTRLDMSEYMEKHEVSKLIGAPPGYVGYEEGGQLTEAVRIKPYSVVLLDEVEKAHPDVFNILLQLLEDGRLTDNKGNTISFKNTIIIATSNIGSAMIQQYLMEDAAKEAAISAKQEEKEVELDAKTIEAKINELTGTQEARDEEKKKDIETSTVRTGVSSTIVKKDEKAEQKEKELHALVSTTMHDILVKIANPAAITNPVEQQQYSVIKNTLTMESQNLNPLAQALLNLAIDMNDTVAQDTLFKVLSKLVDPAKLPALVDQQSYRNLKEGLLSDSKDNNPVSIAVLKAIDAIAKAKPAEKTKDEKEEEARQVKLKELYQVVMGELHKFFKPELLNRFDEVIIFEPLTRKNMTDIAKLRINATRKLLKEQNVELKMTDKALMEVAKEGYDPVYGARPLRRLVQSSIENPIASLILGKTFAGGDTILVDYSDKEEKFTFTKAAAPAAPTTAGAGGAKPTGIATPKPDGTTPQPANTGQQTPQQPNANGQLPTSSSQPYTPPQNPQTQQGIVNQTPNGQPQTPAGSQPYRIVLELNQNQNQMPPAPGSNGVANPLPTSNTAQMGASN